MFSGGSKENIGKKRVNRRQKILRQHRAYADKKEYCDGTIFRY